MEVDSTQQATNDINYDVILNFILSSDILDESEHGTLAYRWNYPDLEVL
jgi:hypothetical protein